MSNPDYRRGMKRYSRLYRRTLAKLKAARIEVLALRELCASAEREVKPTKVWFVVDTLTYAAVITCGLLAIPSTPLVGCFPLGYVIGFALVKSWELWKGGCR